MTDFLPMLSGRAVAHVEGLLLDVIDHAAALILKLHVQEEFNGKKFPPKVWTIKISKKGDLYSHALNSRLGHWISAEGSIDGEFSLRPKYFRNYGDRTQLTAAEIAQLQRAYIDTHRE